MQVQAYVHWYSAHTHIYIYIYTVYRVVKYFEFKKRSVDWLLLQKLKKEGTVFWINKEQYSELTLLIKFYKKLILNFWQHVYFQDAGISQK